MSAFTIQVKLTSHKLSKFKNPIRIQIVAHTTTYKKLTENQTHKFINEKNCDVKSIEVTNSLGNFNSKLEVIKDFTILHVIDSISL